jgi:hypothetical protein
MVLMSKIVIMDVKGLMTAVVKMIVVVILTPW